MHPSGDKDEPNINFMWKLLRTSQHGTQNVETHNEDNTKN